MGHQIDKSADGLRVQLYIPPSRSPADGTAGTLEVRPLTESGRALAHAGSAGTGPIYTTTEAAFTPHAVGLTVSQTLFNGFQTANRTRQAEAQVSAGRATLT